MDWQVGDLAVCVDAADYAFTRSLGEADVVKGRTYRVIDVTSENLLLEGLHERTGIGLRQWRFRKIRPDKHEACEDEFVTLLKRRKVDA